MGKGLEKVSVHGGHSGQYCHHARDTLEQVIEAYAAQGFAWVGITEHMPPADEGGRYPDEVRAGLQAGFLQRRFADYFAQCRELQARWRGTLEIFTAFETEAYGGAVAYVKDLVACLRPDYLVGSVHHVGGICIDYDEARWREAARACGGVEALYEEYFETQYALLRDLEPAVVGHFDLVRLFDPDYGARLASPRIAPLVRRNLEFMKREELILDFNLRGFDKGAEPYPCAAVLRQALDLGIAVVPGDDSHGVASVGRHWERGVEVLRALGAPLRWKRPRLLHPAR